MGTYGVIPDIIIGRTYRKIQKIWHFFEIEEELFECVLITWEN